jgi:hypothetical protein
MSTKIAVEVKLASTTNARIHAKRILVDRMPCAPFRIKEPAALAPSVWFQVQLPRLDASDCQHCHVQKIVTVVKAQHVSMTTVDRFAPMMLDAWTTNVVIVELVSLCVERMTIAATARFVKDKCVLRVVDRIQDAPIAYHV